MVHWSRAMNQGRTSVTVRLHTRADPTDYVNFEDSLWRNEWCSLGSIEWCSLGRRLRGVEGDPPLEKDIEQVIYGKVFFVKKSNHQDFKAEEADIIGRLKIFAKKKELHQGSRVHAAILKRGLLERSSCVANTLVSMYAKCVALVKAELVLQELPARNGVSWSALIAGYVQQGEGRNALRCFDQMQEEGFSPDTIAFVCILKACGSIAALNKGKSLHNEIVRLSFLENNLVLGNTLVDMYAKCGSLRMAQEVHQELPHRDLCSWNCLIAGYSQHGQAQHALNCFEHMQEEGLFPDTVTFICILKACGSIEFADQGEKIHSEIARKGLLGRDIVLGNALVSMYAKYGALSKAKQVLLKELPIRDVVSWSAIIAGYAGQGQGYEALKCFDLMQHDGLFPNIVTYMCILKACGIIKAVAKGEQVHDAILKQGFLGKDAALGNALVDMYCKCGALKKAQEVLEGLPVRNVVSWSALIAGYAQEGQGEEALHCFEMMKGDGFSPNAVTFICLLKACGSIGVAGKGEQIHDEIAKKELLGNSIALGNALVDMYTKCGALGKARKVLEELPARDVVSWSALISGYAQQEQGHDAFTCFKEMQREGISPNAVTFIAVLKACGSMRAIDMGGNVHNEIARQGLLGKDVVLGNALVDMYVRCGAPGKAQEVLQEPCIGDVIAWNILIAAYVEEGQNEDALSCFGQMQHHSIEPDDITFTCILKVYASLGAADRGKDIHDEVLEQGLFGKSIQLGTALVDMYAKCGALAKAQQVLDELPLGDIVSWSVLIAGYAQQGQCEEAVSCFQRMQIEGLSPDAVSFACVLNACSHSGLVDEGRMSFLEMSTMYGIRPDLEHYTCMVDLFGRAGRFDEAIGVIERMPSLDYRAVWVALLAACRKWVDVDVANWVFEHALQMDTSDAATYVCMANIYAAAVKEEDVDETILLVHAIGDTKHIHTEDMDAS